jgi:hypothetical protein
MTQHGESRPKELDLGDEYIKNGQKRVVVGVIGAIVERPVIVLIDVKGRRYDVAPELSTSLVRKLEAFSNDPGAFAKRSNKESGKDWEYIDYLIELVSEACSADAAVLTPEYLKENFRIDILLAFSKAILQEALRQAGEVVSSYQEDPVVKNENGAMAPS